MKKKFLSILLAISFVFGMGMFFVGCKDEKGEDQEKLHAKFCTATSSMSAYREQVTYIYEGDRITEKATYNNETKEFAYLKLSAGDNILARENTKIFNDGIAYYSKTEEKVIDVPYVENLVNNRIFENFLDAVDLDYSGYKADLESRVEEGKAAHINDGYAVTNAYYKIEYKTLADNKYNQTVTVCYEYEKMNSGTGRKLKYEKTTITTFSDDWVLSVKENYDTKINYYSGGEVYDDASDPHEKIYNFSKSFDNEIYTTIDLSNKTSLPTQVATTKLVLVYSPEIKYEYTVAFNVDIAEKSLEHRQPGTGAEYEFYLDENFTTKMPEDYQLNTQKDNVIYIKTVAAEGYTQITEIYQDSQSVRGTKTRIVKLNEVVELDKIYDGKTFDGQVFVDGKYITSSIYTFIEGDSHTILHLVDYNTDMVTETPIVFTINREYSVYSTGTSSHTIPAGTPSEQTLSSYFYKNLVKVYGLSLSNPALSLEFNTNDDSSCSLNKPLAEITATNCTITITIKPDWIVMEGKSQKVESSDTTLEFDLKQGTQSLWLKFGNVSERHNGYHWENTNVIKHSTTKEKGEGNFIECLKLWGFDPGIAYFIYITG